MKVKHIVFTALLALAFSSSATAMKKQLQN